MGYLTIKMNKKTGVPLFKRQTLGELESLNIVLVLINSLEYIYYVYYSPVYQTLQ